MSMDFNKMMEQVQQMQAQMQQAQDCLLYTSDAADEL